MEMHNIHRSVHICIPIIFLKILYTIEKLCGMMENKQVMILKSLAQAAIRDFLSWDFCHSVGASVTAALNHFVGRVVICIGIWKQMIQLDDSSHLQ